MLDTSPLASTVNRDARLAEYTDRLVQHVAEQAGSSLADFTRSQVDSICDAISEGEAVVHLLGSLTCYLTAHFGSAYMVAEGVDAALDNIVATAREGAPDEESRSASYDPFGYDDDVQGFIAAHAE